MCSGRQPFADMHPAAVLYGKQTGSLSLAWPPGVYSPIRKLGELCMEVDPSARPNFDQASAGKGRCRDQSFTVQLQGEVVSQWTQRWVDACACIDESRVDACVVVSWVHACACVDECRVDACVVGCMHGKARVRSGMGELSFKGRITGSGSTLWVPLTLGELSCRQSIHGKLELHAGSSPTHMAGLVSILGLLQNAHGGLRLHAGPPPTRMGGGLHAGPPLNTHWGVGTACRTSSHTHGGGTACRTSSNTHGGLRLHAGPPLTRMAG
eukprot:365047-Chlamydomonas_euryale.AAC.16